LNDECSHESLFFELTKF